MRRDQLAGVLSGRSCLFSAVYGYGFAGFEAGRALKLIVEHNLETLRDPYRGVGAVLCSCGRYARTFTLFHPSAEQIARDAVLSAHEPRKGPKNADGVEHIVFSPAEAVEQMRLRARHSVLLGTILDAQPFMACDDGTIAACAACYLSDALEATSKKYIDAVARQIVDPIETIVDGDIVRHAFLPNAAREMYDALKRCVQLIGGWREAIAELEDFCSEPVRLRNMIVAVDQIDELKPKMVAAISKAEGA